jgi:hypothetical protein
VGLAQMTRPIDGVSTPIRSASPALYSSLVSPNIAHLAPWATMQIAGLEIMWFGGFGLSDRRMTKLSMGVTNRLPPGQLSV